MMHILIALVALFVGVIVGYLISKRGIARAEQHVADLTNQTLQAAATESALRTEVELLKQQAVSEQQRAAEELLRRNEEFRLRYAEQEQRFKDAEVARRTEFKQQLEQQLELVKTQLKQQTEQSNRESITEILRPYREQLEQIKQQSVEDRAALQNEIKRFVETGGHLTREADRLVTALSGSVTIQGNLGEKLLRDILAGSGLKEGVQYKLQQTVRNEDGTTAKNSDGRKMRPDAALIYPETNNILYIDSKFQLPAELDFEHLQAENQGEVLKTFAAKIAEQARKLSDRNYDRSNNEGYIPLPYVIMFVPSETALAAVTNFDRTLWQRMFSEYGVCLASERNLLVLIEMVRYMWQRQVTLDNHEDIIKKAEVVLDRVVDFMVEFGTVEKALADAVNAADKMRGLTSSQGHSIAVAVRNLTALGVKPNKVTKKDRPAQLKSILQRASLPMTEEVEAIDSVESEE
ncbi:MAG: DNA recombination protein RmuC [Alistipes sp.]|nr:DNA recombination protein RmuC [Alistipes sp.]